MAPELSGDNSFEMSEDYFIEFISLWISED